MCHTIAFLAHFLKYKNLNSKDNYLLFTVTTTDLRHASIKQTKQQAQLHGLKEKKKVPSSCVLPGYESSRVNNKNALPVITVAFRKWASPPLPVPGGGGWEIHRYNLWIQPKNYSNKHAWRVQTRFSKPLRQAQLKAAQINYTHCNEMD